MRFNLGGYICLRFSLVWGVGATLVVKLVHPAVAALVALGYKPQEASRMVSKIARPDASSETLIREALRAAL